MTLGDEATILPTPAKERSQLLDILRGFALLGILLVTFRGGIGSAFTLSDRLADRMLDTLIQSSFYPICAILFGAGLALHNQRTPRRSTKAILLHVRRMSALFLIGSAHAVLVWNGDVLVDYALLGILLLPILRVRNRVLVIAFGLLLGLFVFQVPISAALTTRGAEGAISFEALSAGARREQREYLFSRAPATMSGLERDIGARWSQYALRLAAYSRPTWLLNRDVLLLFLAGYLAATLGWFDTGDSRAQKYVAGTLSGISLVTLGYALRVVFGGHVSHAMSWVVHATTTYGLSIAYMSILAAVVAANGRGLRQLERLGPVGRMALTNYLLQSLVMTWLFLPYGAGRPRPIASAFVAVNVLFFFLVQVPFSEWWLKRFKFGPMEWLWRSAAYARFLPWVSETSPHARAHEVHKEVALGRE